MAHRKRFTLVFHLLIIFILFVYSFSDFKDIEAGTCEYCCNILIVNRSICTSGGMSTCYANILVYQHACCATNGDPTVPCSATVEGAWLDYRDVDPGDPRECKYLCSGQAESNCYSGDPAISSTYCPPTSDIFHYYDAAGATCDYTTKICPLPF